jgi:hypothetical protein
MKSNFLSRFAAALLWLTTLADTTDGRSGWDPDGLDSDGRSAWDPNG